MPSLLDVNRLTIIFASFSKPARYLITVLVLLLPPIIWLFFFYLPINLCISKEKELSLNFLKQKQVFQQTLQSFEQAKNENSGLSKQFERYFSKNSLKQNKLNLILTSLQKNNLRCIQFNPLKCKQARFYKKEYYILKTEGDFKDQIAFLKDLEKNMMDLKIKSINAEKEKGGVVLVTKLRAINFSNKL